MRGLGTGLLCAGAHAAKNNNANNATSRLISSTIVRDTSAKL
jgi:hypothetical protein